MRVSVILATRDRPEQLPQAIASVLAQDDPNWELVVFDNGSEPVGHLVPADPRVVCFRGTASGPADAYQQALERATGDIVIPLADDDELAPQAVGVILGRIGDHEWGYARTDYLRDGEVVMVLGAPWSYRQLLGGYYLGGAVFWRRSLSDRVGGFDPEFDGAGDYDLYIRFGRAAEPVYLEDDVLYIYHDWDGTDTRQKSDRQMLANHRIWAKYR